MGLITKNIPQMYKILSGIPLLNPVISKKFDEMQYKMIKNLTQEWPIIFSRRINILESILIYGIFNPKFPEILHLMLSKCYLINRSRGFIAISIIFT